jgi:hypothetical protein
MVGAGTTASYCLWMMGSLCADSRVSLRLLGG